MPEGQKVASLYAEIGAQIMNFQAGSKEVEADLTGMAGKFQQAGEIGTGALDSLGMGMLRFAGPAAIGVAIGETARFAFELANMGMESEQIERRFEAFSGGAENATANLQAMNAAVGLALTTDQQMEAASRIMTLGLAESASEAANVAKMAVMLGSSHESAAARIEGFTQILVTGQTRGLAQYGISLAEVRKRVEELQAANANLSQIEATSQAVMEIAAGKVGQLEAAGYKATTATQDLANAWENLKDKMGEKIAPVIAPVVSELAKEVSGEAIAERDNALRKQAIQKAEADAAGATEALAGARRQLATDTEALSAAEASGDSGRIAQAKHWVEVSQAEVDSTKAVVGAATAALQMASAERNIANASDVGTAAIIRQTKAVGDLTKQYANWASIQANVSTGGGLRMMMEPTATEHVGLSEYAGGANLLPEPTPLPGSARDLELKGIEDANQKRQQALEREKQLAEENARKAESEWNSAVGRMAGDFKSAVEGIPGLFGTSGVSEVDIAMASAGKYQPKVDEIMRQMKDVIYNQIPESKYGISIADLFSRAGIGEMAGGTIETRKAGYLEFQRQWTSGELFAGGKNQDLLNQAAIEREKGRLEAAQSGKETLMKAAGLDKLPMEVQTAVLQGQNVYLSGASLADLASGKTGGATAAGAKGSTGPGTQQTIASGGMGTVGAVNITVTVAAGAVTVQGDADPAGLGQRIGDATSAAIRALIVAEQAHPNYTRTGIPGNP